MGYAVAEHPGCNWTFSLEWRYDIAAQSGGAARIRLVNSHPLSHRSGLVRTTVAKAGSYDCVDLDRVDAGPNDSCG